jgi:hypothetical protein
MSRELLQQALDALDNHNGNYALTKQECADINKVCDNLREELAKPEQELPTLRQVVIESALKSYGKPEQEPVAWMYKGNFHDFDPSEWASPEFVVTPLYTAPPRKEWVGLTDDDTANICMQGDLNDWHDEQVIDAVEAKLKEKNT